VNIDFRSVGLLPSQEAMDFAEKCSSAYIAPEVERDMLKAPNTELLDAINVHAVHVSFVFSVLFALLMRILFSL
jgi:hypothetical protein